jgi:DNA processing protein
MIEGLSNRKAVTLLRCFPSASEIFTASYGQLKKTEFLSEFNIECILKAQRLDKAEKLEDKLQKLKIEYITIADELYPRLLREIPDPPVVLYVKGVIPDESLKVSIVGTRQCTEYGRTVTREISQALAKKGVVVVSGMARGIDSVAHKSALDSLGKTIAVLGCGVDICYPAENRALRDRIIENGCLISEYPPGTQPNKWFFPERNRIISGLSELIIVTEAGKRSGTLITVSHALEQGRDVMAVPGNITSKLSEGTNELLRDGAGVITSISDILHTLNISESMLNIQPKLAPEEKIVYDMLGPQPVSVEEIIDKTQFQAQTVSGILTIMELKGYVQKMSGQRYRRKL